MATMFERAADMLSRNMKAVNSDAGVIRSITVTRKATSETVEGWFGRGMQFTDAESGLRVAVSEREFFFKIADLVTAGFDEPRTGDRYQVEGETVKFEVLDPKQLGEPAWRYSDNERLIVRVHTTLVKVT